MAPAIKLLAITTSLSAILASYGATASTPLDLARAVRARGCKGHPGTSVALRYVGGLNEASLALSQGTALKSAIARSGYREEESTSVHVNGDSAALKGMLANQLCNVIVDPRFSDFGITQRGRDTWMIFAVPFDPPAAAKSASVEAELLQ